MNYQLSPNFYSKLKKLDVRIKNSFWDKIETFERNPYDDILDNHALSKNLKGFRSIDITKDDKYVVIFEELNEGNEIVAYFVEIGHKEELYKKRRK